MKFFITANRVRGWSYSSNLTVTKRLSQVNDYFGPRLDKIEDREIIRPGQNLVEKINDRISISQTTFFLDNDF